jgi:arginine deiminase
VLAVPEQRSAILGDLGRALSVGTRTWTYRLQDLTPEALASTLVAGLERPAQEIASSTDELYYLAPVPNYFFQRDPLVVVGNRAIRGSMATPARLREPLLSGYVFQFHPKFETAEGGRFWFQEFSADYRRPSSYARMRPTLEGGDILVLREDLLAIGYSERTEKTTIERLAESFKAQRFADQADLRRGHSAGAFLHAPRHGFHGGLARRVPRSTDR